MTTPRFGLWYGARRVVARREPKPARERLGPLKPRKPVAKGLIEQSRSMMRSITERDKVLSGEGYVRSALDVRFQPSCRQVSTGESRG
jgi:hypothetical protein